jgi:excinuclease ABC subunit C
MRYDLGHCLGPCSAACTRGEYEDRVRAVRDFLAGRNRSILSSLEAAMRAASDARQFERAVTLRDHWRDLRELDRRLGRLRHVRRRYSFVYPLADHGEQSSGETWYLVRRGWVAAATPAPRDPQSGGRCLELLQGVYGDGGLANQAENPDWDVVLLVSAWFGKRPAELGRTLSVDEAKSHCAPAAA